MTKHYQKIRKQASLLGYKWKFADWFTSDCLADVFSVRNAYSRQAAVAGQL